jgi:hypothetical protein
MTGSSLNIAQKTGLATIFFDIYLEEENFMEYIIEKYQPTKGKKKCLM